MNNGSNSNSGETCPLLCRPSISHQTLTYHHVSLPRTALPRNASVYQRLLSPTGFPRALRIRGSVIPRLILPLVFFGLWATALGLLRHFCWSAFDWGFEVASPLVLSLGLVVGMILGFRTNSAYQRFNEGRQVIANIQTSLRNLKLTFTTPDSLALLPTFLIAISTYLRRNIPSASISPYNSDTTIRFTRSFSALHDSAQGGIAYGSDRVVLVLLERLMECAREVGATAEVKELVREFTNLERLTGTPIPSAYDIHLNQVITLYTLFFPLQISNYFLAIPATMFATFTLFGVEAIGQEIENPFGFDWNDLPLDDYVETFADEVQAAIETCQKAGVNGTSDRSERSWAKSSETLLLEVQK